MQNLQNELINILQHEDALVVDGQLNKNKIVEMALQVDPQLIKHLIKHDTFKTHFFTDVEGVLVFDKIKFQRFVNNKSFLPDSYTAFKNKIGLTINDGTTDNYISTKNDVVLAWPHKDCVLEGGQTKEDQKRNEIFWNETLAPDEIDRLLDPKVFTNWKKYDQQGEHEVTEISDNDNLLIKGNNLLALASLKKRFKNRVKLIYIDPPYNTGSDSFQYNDSFKHSSWLTFMKNRLSFAKELLKPNGVIAIHCDDNEQSYLKNLADEVFLPHNFESTIVVKSSTPSGRKTTHRDKKILKQKDYIHIYSKGGIEKINPQYAKRIKWDTHFSRILNVETLEVYNLVEVLIKEGLLPEKSTINDIDIDNKRIKEFYLANKSTIFQTQPSISDEGKQLSLDNPDKVIKYSKNPDEFALNGRRLVFLEDSISKLDTGEEDLSTLLCDFWNDIDFQNTQNEGGISFPAGKKPEALLRRFLFLFTDENDLVMDFFNGSGSTTAVCLKLNRKFIGVEQLDYGDNDSTKRLINVINGEQSGISKSINWKGGGSFIYCELAKYNQTYADQILEADSKEKLIEVWQEMKEKAFLSYQFDKQSFDERIEAFKTLSLDDQKKFLLEVLDKNQLYVNFSEMADETFEISEADKKLNKQFYNIL